MLSRIAEDQALTSSTGRSHFGRAWRTTRKQFSMQLVEMDLDWDLPPYPSPPNRSAEPLRIQVTDRRAASGSRARTSIRSCSFARKDTKLSAMIRTITHAHAGWEAFGKRVSHIRPVLLAEGRWVARVGQIQTEAPNRVLHASVCRTGAGCAFEVHDIGRSHRSAQQSRRNMPVRATCTAYAPSAPCYRLVGGEDTTAASPDPTSDGWLPGRNSSRAGSVPLAAG